MNKLLFVFALICLAFATPLVDQKLIDEINSDDSLLWTAGELDESHPFHGLSLEEAQSHLLAYIPENNVPEKAVDLSAFNAPASFDSRKQWPGMLGEVRNQGHCGSCWAFGAAEAFSDRVSIATGNKVKLSPQYLVSCDSGNYGCNGGFLDRVWNYINRHGVPSDSCTPYTSGNSGKDGSCPSKCEDGTPMKFYKSKNYYSLRNVNAIMEDVAKNGPAEVAFSVYQDFFAYKGGIYQHKTGGFAGGHAVKLVGWGVEHGVEYWIIANSWGSGWGEQGYFRIRKGTNECNIESNGATAGEFVAPHAMHDEEVLANLQNDETLTWTAEMHEMFDGMTREEFRSNLANLRLTQPNLPAKVSLENVEASASFDSRQKWPQCASIREVRDQGRCGSCWAFGAAEALTDRHCITHGGDLKLSTQYLVSCDPSDHGCNGGQLNTVWNYMKSHGLPQESCTPYVSGTTGHDESCPSTCKDGSSMTLYKAKSAYGIAQSEEAIMEEIEKNGPVEAAFIVYSDFMYYKGGIYQHKQGWQEGGHAIKIIGWGEESGVKYWLIANSWGTGWGESGFFRIKKGVNECGIESYVYAGRA